MYPNDIAAPLMSAGSSFQSVPIQFTLLAVSVSLVLSLAGVDAESVPASLFDDPPTWEPEVDVSEAEESAAGLAFADDEPVFGSRSLAVLSSLG